MNSSAVRIVGTGGTKTNRPHEAPDCPCRGCVAADVGEDLVAEFEKHVPWSPKWAPVLRATGLELKREAEAFEAAWGPLLREMGRASARYADDLLAELMRGTSTPPPLECFHDIIPSDPALFDALLKAFPGIRFIVRYGGLGGSLVGARWSMDGAPHELTQVFQNERPEDFKEALAKVEAAMRVVLDAQRSGRPLYGII